MPIKENTFMVKKQKSSTSVYFKKLTRKTIHVTGGNKYGANNAFSVVNPQTVKV